MALIVNGQRIEDDVIRHEVERLRPEYERVFAHQSEQEREAQLLDWSKENVIERTLVRQDATENGGDVPQKEIESVLAGLKERYQDEGQLHDDFGTTDDSKIKEEIELQIKVEHRIEDICKDLPKPSGDAIREYYEQKKDQFTRPEQARVAHIVKYVDGQTDEQTAYDAIRKAHDELSSGASFEVVVEKYTDCSDSGGDLGNVSRGQMVEEFEDVVFNLGPGQISDIFRTRFGFHIAKLYERTPPTVAKIEDVKSRIVEALRRQMREEAVNEFVDGLKSKADIKEA
jgi:parvulin-like peptidyl-prolyl isomerase